MHAGTLTTSDVQSLTSYVRVNGTTRPALSWSVDRDISSDLPSGVVGGSGITQATGSIEWASESDVEDGALNPWNPSTGWIPREGDAVEIWAGDNNTSWKQFVGVIDTSQGTVGGGMSSNIVDRIDDLSVRANLPALVDVMPPVAASDNWRRFRLTPRWVVQQALRRAGFYATPAPEAHSTVDVPAFGGMWPHIGLMTRCARASNPNISPSWPNGTHVADVASVYKPADPRTADKAVQLTINIAAEHAGTANLQAVYGSANIILRATATHVHFIIGGGPSLCSVPRTGAVTAQVRFDKGQVTLRTSDGKVATATGTWTSSALMSEVHINADAKSRVNGFIVSHPEQPWHDFANIQWSPTANIITGTMHGVMAALPASGEMSTREILNEASAALLWPHWIDESGIMQVVASDVLRDRNAVSTLTTLDDVRELSWKRDRLGVRSKILTDFERITVNRRKDYSLPVWESGASVVLKSGEEHVSMIDPGSDGWIMVDTSPSGVEDSANINAGIGTWVGGVYTDGASEEWTNIPSQGDQVDIRMEPVSDGTWRIVHTALALAAGKQVELRTKRGDAIIETVLWPYWWDKNLPIVRAKGSFTRSIAERPPVTAADRGPTLSHSCGFWATGNPQDVETTIVDAVTAFLASQTTDPHPTITNLRVSFDPRLQLGDVVTVSSTGFMGVELRCLIVGKSIEAGPNGFSLSLSVRVIRIEQSFTTWAEWETAWGATANYAAMEAAWGAATTYADFNNDPLRGTN